MRVLLTVSGTIPPDLDERVEGGRRPRADYRELARAMHADTLDHAAARTEGPFTRLLGRVAGNDVMLAWTCFRRRRRYDVVVTDSEQVGMPYAALTWLVRRRPRHVMIGHRLSPSKKVLLHRALRLQRRIDTVIVYASEQRRVAVERLAHSDVVLSPFMVDTEFWRNDRVAVEARPRPMVCAVGQELRDYPTLVEAVRGLDVDVVIAGASPWSRRTDSSAGLDLPPNVVARGYDLFDLRQLYADAVGVVVPLEESDFQAGITTILEAMSMAKAVVCTRTTGQTDTLADDVTGRYVAPGDAAALRGAIVEMIAAPDDTARLGRAAREWAVDHADISRYAERLAAIAAAGRRLPGRRDPAPG